MRHETTTEKLLERFYKVVKPTNSFYVFCFLEFSGKPSNNLYFHKKLMVLRCANGIYKLWASNGWSNF